MKSIKWCNRMCLIAILAFIPLLSSCADKFIGRQVDTTYWWHVESLPNSRILGNEDSYFVFEMTISKGDVEGEYLLEGHIDPTKGKAKSWGTFQTQKCRFTLLLAKDGVITDKVSFMPVGNSLSRKLPFSKKFKAAPFDSATITWKASVRG